MMLVPASREITASSDAQALRYSTAREKATPDARQLGQQAATSLLNKTPDLSSQP